MDSESLRIFCEVAAELSITHAASKLGRVPSNVTTRVQQLEQELGVPLFIRGGKRMSLSAAGVQFLVYAQRMLALEEEALQVVGGRAEGGSLRLGSMESTAATRLPSILAAYHLQHPGTRLAVKTGQSRQLLDQVLDGRLDCAFVALPEAIAENIADSGLEHAAIWHEELMLLAPQADKDAATAQAIRTRSLATFASGCTYRTFAEKWLDVNAGTGWKVQEVGSYHGMVACVAAGACVAVLPRSVLALLQLPDSLCPRVIGQMPTVLVWRKAFSTPAFEHFKHELGAAI